MEKLHTYLLVLLVTMAVLAHGAPAAKKSGSKKGGGMGNWAGMMGGGGGMGNWAGMMGNSGGGMGKWSGMMGGGGGDWADMAGGGDWSGGGY